MAWGSTTEVLDATKKAVAQMTAKGYMDVSNVLWFRNFPAL